MEEKKMVESDYREMIVEMNESEEMIVRNW